MFLVVFAVTSIMTGPEHAHAELRDQKRHAVINALGVSGLGLCFRIASKRYLGLESTAGDNCSLTHVHIITRPDPS